MVKKDLQNRIMTQKTALMLKANPRSASVARQAAPLPVTQLPLSMRLWIAAPLLPTQLQNPVLTSRQPNYLGPANHEEDQDWLPALFITATAERTSEDSLKFCLSNKKESILPFPPKNHHPENVNIQQNTQAMHVRAHTQTHRHTTTHWTAHLPRAGRTRSRRKKSTLPRKEFLLHL